MALFSGEGLPQVKSISFTKRVAPVTFSPTAEFWFDQTQGNVIGTSGQINVAPQLLAYQNTTPVNVTNNTNATVLMVAPLTANLVNAVGKTIQVFAAGNYNTASGQTPTLTFVIQLGGVNVLSWTSGATTAAQTNMPWELDGAIVLTANGVNANAEAHGSACITLGSNAAAATTTYLDVNSAVSANVNLQANATVAVVAQMSSAAAANVINERLLIVEVAN